MYSITRQEFHQLARRGNLVPVYREINADLETPVSVYLKLRGAGESFLLESVEGGRYHSLIVAEPLPAELRVIAFTKEGEVMGIRHKDFPVYGVQFHPKVF